MGSKAGLVIGLLGGVIAVVGFFMPWTYTVTDFQPLADAFGDAGPVVENALSTSIPPPLFFTGPAFLRALNEPTMQRHMEVAGAPPAVASALGPAVALLLVVTILTAVSSALHYRKAAGPAPRVVKGLQGGRVWFGTATTVLSGFLLASLQWVTAFLSVNFARTALNDVMQHEQALDPGTLSRVAPLLNSAFHSSPSVGLYLCVAGGALVVVGGLMDRKRAPAT